MRHENKPLAAIPAFDPVMIAGFGGPMLLRPEAAPHVSEMVFGLSAKALYDLAAGPVGAGRDLPYGLTPGGVAIIAARGVLMQRNYWYSSYFGWGSYEGVGLAVDHALANDAVRAILLDIDSPGGTVAGCFDCADKIRAAAQTKPLWAVANEAAYSGAYALASGAGRLYLPRSAGVGSIGVIKTHIDQSQANQKRGLAVTEIHAGAHKVDGSPNRPLSERARTAAQDEVGRLHELFCATVAAGRGLTPQAVAATEAACFMGQAAIDAGLADALGAFETALADLGQMIENETRPGHGIWPAAGINPMEDGTMSKPTDAPAVGTQETTASVPAQPDPAALSAAKAEGAKAAKERIAAILACPEAKDRGELARHLAFETDMPLAGAQGILAKAAPEARTEAPMSPADPLATAMQNVSNPDLTPAGGATGETGANDGPEATAKLILSAGL